MSKFNAKGALLIVGCIVLLFGGIETYAVARIGDWSILGTTVFWQLLAITIAVAPMMYGLVFASHHEES